jgi:acetylornithine deacetylase/succinyl-diaminopimelate desuccinylase-like protein
MSIVRRFAAALALGLCACASGAAQTMTSSTPRTPQLEQAMNAARSHVAAHDESIIAELRALLAIPNVATNHADIRRNAEHLVAMLERRGATARVLEIADAPASVYGEIITPGATRTLLFYAHFDGQPPGPLDQWITPPFEPTLRLGRLEDGGDVVQWANARYPLDDNARIYARSASDDKAPIVAFLAALDALHAVGIPPSTNIKFFLEGEEEAGSPNLSRMLTAHRDLLAADIWVFGDGPMDPRGMPRVALGVRGVVSFGVTVYGPTMALHSGHYGNVAPNPAARLAHLIASMRDEDGRIWIDGFETPAPSPEISALAREAYDTAGMLDGPQLPATEAAVSYGEAILRPALNVTQLEYGGTGPARNAIDAEATASFDIRLAPGITPARAHELVARHLQSEGYELVADAPTPEQRRAHTRLARLEWGDLGYAAAAASIDDPAVRHVVDVIRAATDGQARVAPTLGGSLPIAPIGEVLNTPFVIISIVNADNNQHAPNENVRMREFHRGIELYAALLAAEPW